MTLNNPPIGFEQNGEKLVYIGDDSNFEALAPFDDIISRFEELFSIVCARSEKINYACVTELLEKAGLRDESFFMDKPCCSGYSHLGWVRPKDEKKIAKKAQQLIQEEIVSLLCQKNNVCKSFLALPPFFLPQNDDKRKVNTLFSHCWVLLFPTFALCRFYTSPSFCKSSFSVQRTLPFHCPFHSLIVPFSTNESCFFPDSPLRKSSFSVQ